MRLRLGYALELVVVLAVGMSLSRWTAGFPDSARFFATADMGRQVQFLAEPFLVGGALAGGLGLLIESLRRRSPPIWGLGRRTWSVAALLVLLSALSLMGTQSAVLWRNGNRTALSVRTVHYWLRNSYISTFYPAAGWVMAATLVTSFFSGDSAGRARDAREWAGLTLLWLIVAETVVFRILAVLSV